MQRFLSFLKKSSSTIFGILVIGLLICHIVIFQPVLLSNVSYLGGSASDSIIDTLQIRTALEKQLSINTAKYEALTPSRPFILINTTENNFTLYKKKEIVLTGDCSTGSYIKLYNENKSWLFKTPKGVRTVYQKKTDPVWKKPDWAFIEEGLPVPSPNHESRFEYGVLGDYALSIGDGYMIHGTLYQRLMGLSVTHGCIRMKDADLETVYKTLEVGSKVYLY